MTITRAIIPAAGFGTRMLPAAKAIPKEMVPVVDKRARACGELRALRQGRSLLLAPYTAPIRAANTTNARK